MELLRSLGHEVTERDPDYGYDAIPAVLVRYLRGIHDDAAAHGAPRAPRTAHARRWRASGGLIPQSVLERALAGEQEFARRLGGVLESHDVLLTPATAAPPPRIGRLEGRGALWTLNAVARLGALQRRVERHRPARRVGAGRASAPDGLPRGGADRGPRQRRDHAAVARRADRGRAPLGAAAPARVLVSEADALLEVAVEAARMAGALLAERVAQGRRARGREQEHARPTSSARPTSPPSGRSGSCSPSAAPTTASSARRASSEGGSSGLSWVVDPLDGTVNFLFGIPQWCVSVAVRDDAGALAGRDLRPEPQRAVHRHARAAARG